MSTSFATLLRLEHDSRPTAMSTDATPGFRGGKKRARKNLASLQGRLAELQEQLFANGRTGDRRRVLLVLQGMDTSGKGGVIDHVTGLVSPQGLAIRSFKTPTAEEQAHDFLWRIRQALPAAGQIGVFDRSHYEDVLIARVHDLVTRLTWTGRYDSIANFEAELAKDGVSIIKCFLHISPAEQQERLLARLDDPTKHWKYNPSDVDERGFWSEYAAAYDDALTRTNTDRAPWFVIPSDHKWYRNLAVSHLLLEHLEAMALEWPKADFDPATERHRLQRQANGKLPKVDSHNGKPAKEKPRASKPTRTGTARSKTKKATTRPAPAAGNNGRRAVASGRPGSRQGTGPVADRTTSTAAAAAMPPKTSTAGDGRATAEATRPKRSARSAKARRASGRI